MELRIVPYYAAVLALLVAFLMAGRVHGSFAETCRSRSS